MLIIATVTFLNGAVSIILLKKSLGSAERKEYRAIYFGHLGDVLTQKLLPLTQCSRDPCDCFNLLDWSIETHVKYYVLPERLYQLECIQL